MGPTLFLPNGASQKKMAKTKDVHSGETTLGRLLILHGFKS
jgi:hypothetical protein